MYGAFTLYQEHLKDKIEEWLPKTEDENLSLAKDLALYMQCKDGRNYLSGNTFFAKGKGQMSASEFITYCLTTDKAIWKACDLDNKDYSISLMENCVHDLIEKTCK